MGNDQSSEVRHWLTRLGEGDASARDELLACACERLRRLTRKMLRSFPGVRQFEETDDVFHEAVLRLCRALRDWTPTTVRDFFRLAALQIRRELIDMARHYQGREAAGAAEGGWEAAGTTDDPLRLAAWAEFHQAIGALPDEQREMFDLLWYQGLTQAEAGNLLEVSVTTVKRRWQSARRMVFRALGGEIPI
jgi:RNA polymerase sigma-70 factor (ECF subfamily)